MSGWALAVNSAERPNVVLMLADNLGFGDIGAYGGGAVLGTPTPSLDALAADGLMLTQFFVEPGCTPSRAGLMTGRYSVRSGLNSIIVAGTPLTLKDEEFTIAELFKKHGYRTGMMGKWHLGQEAQSLPTNQGFDSYYGIPYSNDMDRVADAPNYREMANDPNWYPDTNSYNVPLMDGEKVIERPADQNTITKRFTEKAVGFIEAN